MTGSLVETLRVRVKLSSVHGAARWGTWWSAAAASFDQGHQPWRGKPFTDAELWVAGVYGWRHPHGTLLSATMSPLVDDTIGENADVRGRRRDGDETLLITSVQRAIGQD
jgi:hypothetical protein